jgi:hypothetical protein
MCSLASACCASQCHEGTTLKISIYTTNACSRLEHGVSLLPPLEALYALLVHLLTHLLVPFTFLLCGAFCPDGLNSSLLHSQPECLCQPCLPPRTCRSDSFSSFSSFSLALFAASAFRSSVRLSHDVWFARGRKADLLSCHCLPGHGVSLRCLAVCARVRHTVLLHTLDNRGGRRHRRL